MIRSAESFPEAMSALQNAILEHDYTISFVQRIDVGLTNSGFKTDKYRVVFFGKLKEINEVVEKEPDMIAFAPLKISIFAENDQTILVTHNPMALQRLFPDKALINYFLHWESDIRSIFSDVLEEDKALSWI